MISQKLKTIFFISTLVFIAHGLEEYFTGLYNFDSFYQSFSNPKAVFIFVVLVLANTLLIISYMIIRRNKWVLGLSIALGLLFIFELIHIYDAIRVGGYYPGLITSLAFPIISIFLWKELLKNYKTHVE